MNKGVSSRRVASYAVMRVIRDRIPLETALSYQQDYASLDPRDRAFARLITATVFRRMGQIDAALAPFIKQKISLFIRSVLRVGAAQLLYIETPSHAAVSETVNVVKLSHKDRHAANMVNAIMRRIVEEGRSLAAQTAPQANIPPWIARRWDKSYGKRMSARIALSLTQAPPLDLTMKSGAAAPIYTQDNDEALTSTFLPPATVRLTEAGQITRLSGYEAGKWWIQDIAATLPVHFMGEIKDKTVLDMCAAPGGKTLQLAAHGANVTALDKSETRLLRLKENLKRTHLEAKVICSDALTWDNEDKFDIVLLDAPCSATGTLRRNPDVLWNRRPEDIDSLTKLQDKLLMRAAHHVKPGGDIIFCTCSLQNEEGAPRISAFLEKMPDFRLNPLLIENVLELDQYLSTEGYFRSFPHFLADYGGMDGFFIAKLTRKQA